MGVLDIDLFRRRAGNDDPESMDAGVHLYVAHMLVCCLARSNFQHVNALSESNTHVSNAVRERSDFFVDCMLGLLFDMSSTQFGF